MVYSLEELFDLQMGKTPSRNNFNYWNTNDNKWVSISDLSQSGRYIHETKEYISDDAIAESGIKVIPANTVIMSFKLSIGKVAITKEEMYSNEAIMAFHDKHTTELLPEYIYYLFRNKDWSIGTNKAVMGKTLNKATLSQMKISVCSIQKQREIVSVLNKVSEIIDNMKDQIFALDELIKSRFVEMFGDMLLNTMGWDESSLESIAEIVSGISKGRKVKNINLREVPYMAVSNVKDGYIDWTTIKTIMATEQEIEQYRLMPNDILMTEGGDPDKLGRGAIIKEPMENSIHQNHIFRVRLNRELILPMFFEEYLQHQKAKRYFLRCAKQTTGIASINMKQLRALPVLIPSLELQNQFATFVHQIDKLKLTAKESLKKLEIMQKALMQQYFC